MNIIPTALIGCGFLGTRHAKSLINLSTCKLVSICDHTEEHAALLSKTTKTEYCTNYKDLIGKVDAVIICTPTVSHHEIASFFLDHNVHVFVEKPITTNVDQANDLVTKAAAHNLTLQVGHVERFNSAYQTIEPLIQKPLFIECHRLNHFPNRSLDIGVVLDLMIHDLDIVLGLVKSPIQDVQAVGVNVLTEKEDIANVRISFKNGCVANLTSSRISVDVTRRIRIFTDKAYFSLDYASQEAQMFTKTAVGIKQEIIPIDKDQPLKRELIHFFNCIIHRQKPIIAGVEARDALALALTITKQIWEHKQNILSS